ncbi:MAG: proton-conducting transporter membrane subunit [Candidatus Brocadiia bacterium]|jgi:NADH-quinone oxidoreductase subunit L
MTDWMPILFWPIFLPLAGALLVLAMPKRVPYLREAVALLAALGNLVLACDLFGETVSCSFAWCAGLTFTLRLYRFSAFFLLAVAFFSFLVTLYCWKFMRDRSRPALFYAYLLISLAMANGIVLADHLVVLLFFWEGLLGTTFGMIALGSPGAFKTATKMFIIVGITDLCMLFGIALTGWQSSLVMHQARLPISAMGCLAAALLAIGAVSKAGSVPFHTWIPDAAVDAPLPFMAFLPASLEKLLGIYMLARITLDLFPIEHTWLSPALMILGSAGLLIAVMMALVQKNYKRLLSYHAISQVGYMILGLGTALPAGVIGGLFHMLNNALYKSGLFMTAGSVEKQTGTTDLSKLGGLASRMPVTFACYLVFALSISGCPPFNGFFSKELIYDAAKERHVVFYLAALLGTFLTAASFLKLGHAAYFGKRDPSHDSVREAPVSMLAPMIVIAALCVLFGVWNALPVNHLGQITPLAGPEPFAGMQFHPLLAGLAVLALAAALVHHLLGAKAHGGGLHAVDHIRNAPGLCSVYDGAEKRYFDPYDLGMKLLGVISAIGWACDRGLDWVYDRLAVGAARGLGWSIRAVHTGNASLYVLWALGGAAAVIAFVVWCV